jgi:hypothetical protein
MRYYITSAISDHIKSTPEGYLLCLEVPIARTGIQEYSPEEVSLPAAAGGDTVKVYRLEAEVFDPDTMASFEGKPVTIDHPEEFVNPENWRELSRGVAHNLRRGNGSDSDLLLADLLITDAKAIKAIQGGLRQISCGYDADYEEMAPGLGRQTNIIGNHVALVGCGRCGTRCQIQDKQPKCTESKNMKSFIDWLKKRPKLQKAFDEALAEEEKEKQAPPAEQEKSKDDDPMAALAAKVEELTIMVRGLAEKAPTADEDGEEKKSEDEEQKEPVSDSEEKEPDKGSEKSAATGDSQKFADADTVSRAQLLSPALHARIGDTACVIKKAALRNAQRDADLNKTICACLGGKGLDSADCLTVDAAFMATSEVAKIKNNRKTADALVSGQNGGSGGGTRGVRDFGLITTPEKMNQANREFYAREKK